MDFHSTFTGCGTIGIVKVKNSEGSLLKIYGPKDPRTGKKEPLSKNWFAQYYDSNGRQIRVSTGTDVLRGPKGALRFLRDALAARDKGLAPQHDARRVRYADLRAGLLANLRAA